MALPNPREAPVMIQVRVLLVGDMVATLELRVRSNASPLPNAPETSLGGFAGHRGEAQVSAERRCGVVDLGELSVRERVDEESLDRLRVRAQTRTEGARSVVGEDDSPTPGIVGARLSPN